MRKRKIIKKHVKQRGQGMTEYIVIVALIAIGSIAVVTIFGDNIRALFGSSANVLAGSDSPGIDAQEVTDESALKKSLKDFHDSP